jgi:hypothetical protein
VFRAPLASFAAPEDWRQVIGRIAIKHEEVTMVFDESYSANFGRGIRIGHWPYDYANTGRT